MTDTERLRLLEGRREPSGIGGSFLILLIVTLALGAYDAFEWWMRATGREAVCLCAGGGER